MKHELAELKQEKIKLFQKQYQEAYRKQVNEYMTSHIEHNGEKQRT